MPTNFSDVLTGAVMQDVDDVRWQDQLATNPALFFRSKSQLLMNAVPRFNKPPEMEEWLAYTEPSYDEYSYTATSPEVAPITIQTGKTGFDLCSGGIVTKGSNTVSYTPVEISYDAETGDVVINTGLSGGQTVDFDFYTDGYFENDLTQRQQRILGMCVAYDWYRQFAATYLGITPKIIDPKFKINGTESGKIRADSERMRYLEEQLNGELNNYERACAYAKRVPDSRKIYP